MSWALRSGPTSEKIGMLTRSMNQPVKIGMLPTGLDEPVKMNTVATSLDQLAENKSHILEHIFYHPGPYFLTSWSHFSYKASYKMSPWAHMDIFNHH